MPILPTPTSGMKISLYRYYRTSLDLSYVCYVYIYSVPHIQKAPLGEEVQDEEEEGEDRYFLVLEVSLVEGTKEVAVAGEVEEEKEVFLVV